MRDEPDFGAWLRSRLDARRMSQRQLASRSGVNHSTISRLIRGERSAGLRTVLALQAALSHDAADHVVQRALPLHPARLFTMLRNDGHLTDDEIGAVVSLYARFVDRKSGHNEH